YSYDASTQTFPTPPFTGLTTVVRGTNPPTNPSDNWSLVQATVTSPGKYGFAQVFGFSTFNTQALATAVHRPRDAAILLDYAGSMRFGCLPGIPISSGTVRQSNNPDPVFPTFGHYSDQSTAALQATSSPVVIATNSYSYSNITTTVDGKPPLVNDFYSSVSGSGTLAFSSAGTDNSLNYAATSPGD